MHCWLRRSESSAQAQCVKRVSRQKKVSNIPSKSFSSKAFLNEISMLDSLGMHEHVVQKLRVLNLELGPAIALEYCSNGDLLSFLRRSLASPKKEVYSVSAVVWKTSKSL